MLEQQLCQSCNQDSVSKCYESEPVSPKLMALISDDMPPFVVCQRPKIRREEGSFEGDSEGSELNIQDRILTYSRKDKSLMELSRKFIEKFEGAHSSILVLDQVATELQVERRRIYDIINIMESLTVVSKLRKNVYQWKGLQRAIETIELLKNGHFLEEPDRTKREKSLELLATEFLKLFSSSRQELTLEEAAQTILGEASENVKKTKIRRLYDIINVFKCLGLVEKVKTQKLGSKSVYRWNGCHELHNIIQQKRGDITHQIAQKLGEVGNENIPNNKQQLMGSKANNRKGRVGAMGSLNHGLRDISNSMSNSASSSISTRFVEKQSKIPSISFIATKSESKKQASGSWEQSATLDTCDGLGDGPSFFSNLGRILNWGESSSILEIQVKLRESMWPS